MATFAKNKFSIKTNLPNFCSPPVEELLIGGLRTTKCYKCGGYEVYRHNHPQNHYNRCQYRQDATMGSML